MVTAEDVRFQMRLLGYKGMALNRGEIRELPDLLKADETIQSAIYGSYEGGFGLLVATNHRLLFIDRRFFHKHFSDIPYENISAVEFDSGLFAGCVRVYARIGDIMLHCLNKGRAREFFAYLNGRIETKEPAPV